MSFAIHLTETDAQIQACFAVMIQLRPHLLAEEFVERVRRQMQGGYQLAAIQTDKALVAVAGFRVFENLIDRRVLYVDDLVVDAEVRSQGYGAALLDWLADYARTHGCDTLQLDSGVKRFAAHRFYFQQRMHISSYHFRLYLNEDLRFLL